jgi:hypothetical protein
MERTLGMTDVEMHDGGRSSHGANAGPVSTNGVTGVHEGGLASVRS